MCQIVNAAVRPKPAITDECGVASRHAANLTTLFTRRLRVTAIDWCSLIRRRFFCMMFLMRFLAGRDSFICVRRKRLAMRLFFLLDFFVVGDIAWIGHEFLSV